MKRIDCHTHILPEKLPDWSRKFGYGDFIRLEPSRKDHANMMMGSRFFREIHRNCWDANLRIDEYARFKTDVQVVSTIPVLFSYWAKAHDALEISKFLNDHIAELSVRYPKNYIGLGTVPMQDPSLAITEIERCKSIGLRGIEIGSNINGENLSDPKFFSVFEACERLGMAILIHPWNMMGEKEMQRYWLPWLVGMPAETTRAVCSMIFGGVLERLPKLRVNFSHAGGSFFATVGRISHGFQSRPDLVAIDNKIDPADYIGKFWVDCITHDPDFLSYILPKQGSKRITLGSDYPFPLGDLEIGSFVDQMSISESEKEDIFLRSALEWLGMDQNSI
ncbi:MAG: amidohydrolase [Bacteroidetes bacterium]|nr:amidohydrolase [Bacteroidota bacterium]